MGAAARVRDEVGASPLSEEMLAFADHLAELCA